MIRVTAFTTRCAGICLAAALALAAGSAAAQGEPALIKRATELREAPAETARSLAPLAAQDTVTRLAERKGPWIQVRTGAGATGWVHLFDLGPTNATQTGSATGADALRGITNLFSRSSGSNTVATSASGLRGLDAADLARAQPDMAAVSRMEALRQDERQARQFARGAALSSAAVEPLPAPQRAGPAGNPGQQEAQ